MPGKTPSSVLEVIFQSFLPMWPELPVFLLVVASGFPPERSRLFFLVVVRASCEIYA